MLTSTFGIPSKSEGEAAAGEEFAAGGAAG